MKNMRMKAKLPLLLLSLYVILTPSCKKWLEVSSDTQIVSEDQFNDVTGFRDAVIGVYVKMAKPELYAQEMTWRTVEFLSQQYAVVASAPDLNVPLYAWDVAPLPGKRETIWLGAYNAIANINHVLSYHAKNREVFAKTPITDSLVKGEMLALRAFLHFDLMRLFGKSNPGGRPALQNQFAIPYITSFSKEPTLQRTYKETMALMLNDIEEAIKFLECDPLSRLRTPSTYWSQELGNGFISTSSTGTANPNRKMRMNYWAAKALYARILMWEGSVASKAKALQVALEVMGSTLSGGIGTGAGAYYSWTTASSLNTATWYTGDVAFVNEQLFTLQVEKFFEYQKVPTTGASWFNAASPNAQYSVVFLTPARRSLVYEAAPLFEIDWRSTKSLMGEGPSGTNYALAKLYQHLEHSASYSKRMPLIRVTEMYYIAAEALMEPGANYDRVKAVACLNKVRNQRNIIAAFNLDAANLTDEQIKTEIMKEYMKEFVGEGQLFFYYKRLGLKNIPGYVGEMTDAEYQMPMPDSEMVNGGSRSN